MAGAQKSRGRLLFFALNLTGINRKNWQTLVCRNLATQWRASCSYLQCLASDKFVLNRRRFITWRWQRDQDFSVEALPQLFSQVELNDLVRDLNLPKNSASQLKEKNLLENGVRITFYRSRHEEFLSFFGEEWGRAGLLQRCMSVDFLINLVLRNTNQRNGVFP